MAMKLKFNPEITRIKLNPEQAVLACSCYNRSRTSGKTSGGGGPTTVCKSRTARPKGTCTVRSSSARTSSAAS